MNFKIIATDNYSTASKAVLQMLKKADQTNLSVNHVVISNDRCRMTSELEMLDALGGSFNTHVLTFARLTTRLMKEKPFISKQSAIMLISRLAEELCDKFLCFTRSYNTAGFSANIYETISQLKYSAISPEQINPSDFDKNLQLKMHDIKLIYQAYEDFIKERYIDSGAKLNHLIKAIPDSDFVKNSYFYIKDFDDFSTQEELIIRQLVIYSKGVVVAIPYKQGRRIYSSENFDHLLQIAKGLKIEPDLTFLTDNQTNYVYHLANNLFDYKTEFEQKPAQNLFVAKESDIFAEAELVAKHICQQTRDGARYKDFLIVAFCIFMVVRFMMKAQNMRREWTLTKAEIKALRKQGKSFKEIEAIDDQKKAEIKAAEEAAKAAQPAPETVESLLKDIKALLTDKKDKTE